MRLNNTILAQIMAAMIVCSLAIMLLPATVLASPGHGVGILPDDPGHEEPSQHDEAGEEADMTEVHMGAETTETHSADPAAEEVDDHPESTATAKNDAKKESSGKEAGTAAADEKQAEKADHDSANEHYAVNTTNTNGYPVAVGITLGALTAFGLALRYL